VDLKKRTGKPATEIWQGVLSASGVLAVTILLGRLAGFVRELQLGAKFGLSHRADIAVLLLSIPDLFVSLLISGGLSAVLVPHLKSLPAGKATRFFHEACLCALGLFVCIAAAFAIIPNLFFQGLAPGLPADIPVAPAVVLCVAISIPLTALTGVTAAYLNANDRFLVAGLGTLIFNLVIIGSLLGATADEALAMLGLAILIGAAVRLLSQIIALPRVAFRCSPGSPALTLPIFQQFLLGTAATSLALVPPILVRAVASFLAPGNIAAFNYAQKLIELPVGVLITTIGTVALTKLSGHAEDNADNRLLPTLLFSLRLAILAAVCIMLFGYPLMEAIAAFLFLSGQMTPRDVQVIAQLAAVMLAGVPFVAINSILSVSLYARHETSSVLRTNIAAVIACALLTVPGLLAGDPQLLMAAVVGSQILLSTMLARRTGIRIFGEGAVADMRFVRSLFLATVLALPFIGAAVAMVETSVVIAFTIAAVGFACSVLAALRLMIQQTGQVT
jgi:putative peptidoglycan lipid II flippase